MGVFRCLWGLGLGDRSILVYAYILMYYTKNRGFENQWFFSEGFKNEGFENQWFLKEGFLCATTCVFD